MKPATTVGCRGPVFVSQRTVEGVVLGAKGVSGAAARRCVQQQVVPGRGKEQAIGGPSQDEVLCNLSEHPEGLPLEAMQARLDAPLERLDEILSRLIEERKVLRDKEHNLYLHEGQ